MQGGQLGLGPRQPCGNQRGKPFHRRRSLFELDSPRRRRLTVGDVPGEPFLDLVGAATEEVPPLLQTGRPHLQIGAEHRHGRGPLVERGAGVVEGPAPLGGGGLVGLESWQAGLELGDPSPLGADAVVEVGDVGPQPVELGLGVAPVGLDACQAVGGGDEPTVVLVERTSERLFGG